MREWIEIDGAALIEQGDLVTEAIAFAGQEQSRQINCGLLAAAPRSWPPQKSLHIDDRAAGGILPPIGKSPHAQARAGAHPDHARQEGPGANPSKGVWRL